MKVKRWEKGKHFLSYRLSIDVCNFTLQLYWGKIIKYNCKIFKLCNLMVLYTYILWKYSPHGVNKSITSRVYFFLGGMRTFMFSSLYNTELLWTILIIYYLTSSDFIHLITENVYSFYWSLPISPHLQPQPMAMMFLLSVAVWYLFFRLHIYKWYHVVFVFLWYI